MIVSAASAMRVKPMPSSYRVPIRLVSAAFLGISLIVRDVSFAMQPYWRSSGLA